MKTKKLLTVMAILLVLVSFLSVSAHDYMLPDSNNWENLSDKEATALLKSTKSSKDQSFIFIYYRNTCGNSQVFVPQFEEYARQNGIKLYGLDETEYRNWTEWSRYTSAFMIGFPLVFAYNHTEDALYSEDSVYSVSAFKNILEKVNYPLSTVAADSGKQDKQPEVLFNDVDENNQYFKAIKSLASKGIITGYDNNTFRPENPINRAEAATVIVRASNLSTNENAKSIYYDVTDDFWGTPYIMAATEKGIINGMGNNQFAPDSNVTHNQIIKMVVCMMDLDGTAERKGGWPYGYLTIAAENGIIDYATYEELYYGQGNNNATRGDVAKYVYNAVKQTDSQAVYVGGKKYYIGMSVNELNNPDEILPSTYDYDWYVYGTETYTDFVALGILDYKVVSIASSGLGFSYMDYKAGDLNTDNTEYLETDKNDNNKIHAVFIDKSGKKSGNNTSERAFAGESKMNFHFANAFRVLHGKRILKWSDNAAVAAMLHSQDMADLNYFAHDSADGRKFSRRLSDQGISWNTCGENISAGRATGFHSYCSWVNSSGHRTNMLNTSYRYLGVGAGYNPSSTYRFYFTQDFYA